MQLYSSCLKNPQRQCRLYFAGDTIRAMDTRLEIKLRNRLKDWETAHKKKDEFLGHQLTGEAFIGKDPFKMALAYADEQRAWNYYELALAEAYPEEYPREKVEYLKQEVERLNKRIRAFKNRQWPSRD